MRNYAVLVTCISLCLFIVSCGMTGTSSVIDKDVYRIVSISGIVGSQFDTAHVSRLLADNDTLGDQGYVVLAARSDSIRKNDLVKLIHFSYKYADFCYNLVVKNTK